MKFAVADLATGLIGGSLSVLLLALIGRYLSVKLSFFEDGRVVGFCLAAGLVLGQGTIIRGSPTPEEVELLGRSVGSLLALAGLWLAWFKLRSSADPGSN